MSRNWLRSCTLSLSGGSSATVTGGGDTDLRIEFAIEQWSTQSTNLGRFRIYNPSQRLANQLQAKEFTKLTFSGGYQGNTGLLFSGDIRQTISGHETATDTFVDLFAADGDRGYNSATVNRTLAAGYTPADKLKVATDALGQYGLSFGLVNVDLSQPKFPRGALFSGMARTLIREVALLKGALWSIQNGEIRIVNFKQPIQSNTVVMSGATGMVGWPKQTSDGIIVSSLLNPRLQPHVNLKINPALINQAEQNNNPLAAGSQENQWLNEQNVSAGIYNIFKLNRHGDTRGSDWLDQAYCVGAVSGIVPPSARAAGYYIGSN